MALRACSLASLLVGSVAIAGAQDPPSFKKAPNPGEGRVRVIEMRDGRRPVKGAEETKNKADMLAVAKMLLYPITDPSYYSPPEVDPRKASDLKPIPTELTLQAKFDDFDRYIHKPTPTIKLNFDQCDYLMEMGIAVDTVLRELLTADAPVYVRVNAARALALAAKSGAPAHAKMITEMIADPATPPEILNYALQAAGNLLGAFDAQKQGGTNAGQHTIRNPELVQLVQALETVVNRQTPYGNKKTPAKAATSTGIVKEQPPTPAKKDDKKDDKSKTTNPPTGKIDSSAAVDALDPDDAAVIRYLRRHAIRAMAQVRYPIITDAKSNVTVRPLFTLCRVAVNDGPFIPALGPDEFGDAVIGMCNMQNLRGVDLDVVLNCIAVGTGNFARRKVGSTDSSIAWKTYAVRMNTALTDWQKLLATNTALQKIQPLANIITNQVLNPLEQYNKGSPGGPTVNLEGVSAWVTPRLTMPWVPFSDLKDDEKAKLTLKPVLAKN